MLYVTERTEICIFADNTTPYSSYHDLKEAMTNIEHDCANVVEWFRTNFVTLNAEKCHPFVSDKRYEAIFAKVGDGNCMGRTHRKTFRYANLF